LVSILQALSQLSAIAWRWVLPNYLRFCLAADAEYSRMEMEFFIYNLGPADEFQKDTVERLSKLDRQQMDCLIKFMHWCLSRQYGSAIEQSAPSLSNEREAEPGKVDRPGTTTGEPCGSPAQPAIETCKGNTATPDGVAVLCKSCQTKPPNRKTATGAGMPTPGALYHHAIRLLTCP
jgi:hypothetical protein